MIAPSKPVKTRPAMNVYVDTDDDDLSDISEKSQEEDISDASYNKNVPTNTGGYKDKEYSDSLQTPKSNLFTPESSLNDKDNNQNKKQGPTGTTQDDDDDDDDRSLAEGTAAAAAVGTPAKTVVKARRLEQSDSEDTSAADSQFAKKSAADTFYSPDGSVADANDDEDQSLKASNQNDRNQIKPFGNEKNESLSKPSNQQRKTDDTDEDEDSASEESSSESQTVSFPPGKMAMGEPYTYIIRSVLCGLNTNITCVCGESLLLSDYWIGTK